MEQLSGSSAKSPFFTSFRFFLFFDACTEEATKQYCVIVCLFLSFDSFNVGVGVGGCLCVVRQGWGARECACLRVWVCWRDPVLSGRARVSTRTTERSRNEHGGDLLKSSPSLLRWPISTFLGDLWLATGGCYPLEEEREGGQWL